MDKPPRTFWQILDDFRMVRGDLIPFPFSFVRNHTQIRSERRDQAKPLAHHETSIMSGIENK
jgi:hypothetical protein